MIKIMVEIISFSSIDSGFFPFGQLSFTGNSSIILNQISRSKITSIEYIIQTVIPICLMIGQLKRWTLIGISLYVSIHHFNYT